MGDQSSVLTTGTTKIDALKGVHTANTGVDGFNEVFGCSSDAGFTFDWLMPIRAVFPDHVRDRVLGFHCYSAGQGGLEGTSSGYMPVNLSPGAEGAGLELHDLRPGTGAGTGAGAGVGAGGSDWDRGDRGVNVGGGDGDSQDLARQRLGSTELWGMAETGGAPGAVPEVHMTQNSGVSGGQRWMDNVRRRSGPPF